MSVLEVFAMLPRRADKGCEDLTIENATLSQV
jgi:hypothetical protein